MVGNAFKESNNMNDNKRQHTGEYRNVFKDYLDQLQQEAYDNNWPGPAVSEHPAGYKGICYCWECLKAGWKK